MVDSGKKRLDNSTDLQRSQEVAAHTAVAAAVEVVVEVVAAEHLHLMSLKQKLNL